MKNISIGYPTEYEDDKGVIRTGLWLKEKEVELLEKTLKKANKSNNIIEELEKWLRDEYSKYNGAIRIANVLDKLRELKEGK